MPFAHDETRFCLLQTCTQRRQSMRLTLPGRNLFWKSTPLTNSGRELTKEPSTLTEVLPSAPVTLLRWRNVVDSRLVSPRR